MRRSLISPLIVKLGKIYFSNIVNKEHEYKRTLFYTLKDMGGVYIKFLQAICVTQNFMAGWGSPKEYEVFNKVRKEPIDIARFINKEPFLYIEEEPFACGSFAQLYKAKLKTGQDLAIKIIRPSVGLTLKSDLKKLKRMIKIMSVFLPDTVLDYKAAFDEFSRTCLLETDYAREIANMEYFSDFYKNHDYVVIPKVYKEFSNKYVIAQEFIEGPTLADVISDVKPGESLTDLSYKLTGSNVWTQIMIAGGEALRTAITAEYVYGDPHPGNIILLSDNRIAFVDFGIIANKPTSQEAFYEWVKAYYNILTGKNDYGKLLETSFMCFCPDLVNALNKCSVNNNFIESLSEALNKKAQSMTRTNTTVQNLAHNGHFAKIFLEFVDGKNAINIKLDMRNFRLLKAMQAYLSSVTTIDNKHGNGRYAEIMKGSMEYALDYCEKVGVKGDLTTKTKYNVSESHELLVDMVTSLANGDEYLFNNISRRMF